MSRCFPFPPPGYEKKPRPDESNLLIKEKHKEEKHKKEKDKEKKEKKDKGKKEKKDKGKKEKKDKEKKGKKEKKDKDRSEEKLKEKKEKKDKHREKKDKERDKEKKKTPQEKNVLGTSEHHQDVGKSGPTGTQGGESQTAFLLQLEKRLTNNDGPTESKMFGANQVSFRLRGKVPGSNANVLSDAKEKFKDKRDDHKMVNGQTLMAVARAMENGVAPIFIGEDQKKDEGGVFQVEKVNEKGKERKEKNKHKKDGKGNKHQERDHNRQNKSKDGEGEKEEEKKEKVIEERSKVHIEHSNIDMVDIHSNGQLYLSDESSTSKGFLGKRKDPVSNGVICDNDSLSNKFLRPVSSSGQVMQNGTKDDPPQAACQFTSERQVTVQDHKVNAKVSIDQLELGNGRKLAPGHIVSEFISEQKIALNNHKVHNSLFPLQPVGRTGMKLESCQAAANSKILGPGAGSNPKVSNNVSSLQSDVENQTRSNGGQGIMLTTAERRGTMGLHKADDKKQVINGLIKSEESKKVKEKSETHKRSPHPDSKYLSQILTVPEVEWSDFDDQEWLFTGSDSKAKKPKTVPSQVEETKQVWAEALLIESIDAVALPYVIPY